MSEANIERLYIERLYEEIFELKEENTKLKLALRKAIYEVTHVSQCYANIPKAVIDAYFKDEIELI